MAEVRDLAIIILAAIFILIGLGLGVLVVMMVSLVFLIRKRLGPLLDSALSTLDTIESASSFVSDTMVRPIIKATSFGVGAKAAVSTILRLRKRKGGR
ncbi:MAG: hypothetical protein Q8R28_20600 [Dehalococcoidia bacterium]|nr:hypothetical protein [Dehalococcoidia bacterium]